MLISFFDTRFITYFEFVSEEITVNQTSYVEVLKRLSVAVRLKRGGLLRDRAGIFLASSVAVSAEKHLRHGPSAILF
jgi:hypothetical protein